MRLHARSLARSLPLVAASLVGAACGGAQHRPSIVAVFPADGQTVAGWLDTVRVTYDEPVRVLNSTAIRMADDETGEAAYVEAFADPADARSILIKPIVGGHFFPGHRHHLVIQQGVVVNSADHYKLEEYSTYFTVGSPPDLVVTSSDGKAYRLDATTGAVLSTATPPAGYKARGPVGTTNRIWVWLDPTAPGDAKLGTFAPGDAAITIVPIAGETGVRTGVSLVTSLDARTLYATTLDAGRNRGRVHRIDVASLTEVLGSIELTPVLAGSPASYRACLDIRRERLYVPFADGTGGARIAIVDLATFTELDAGPGAGVDALPIPFGVGDMSYEPYRDSFYMAFMTGTVPGFLEANPHTFELFPATEPTLSGVPVTLYVAPYGDYVIEGLDAYPTTSGLVRSEAVDIGEGFTIPVLDDVGGTLQGSDRVLAIVTDPSKGSFHAFSSDGVESFLLDYEWATAAIVQIDLDTVTAGTQALALAPGVPGIVTGAAYALGVRAP